MPEAGYDYLELEITTKVTQITAEIDLYVGDQKVGSTFVDLLPMTVGDDDA